MSAGGSQKFSTRPIKPQAFRPGGRFRGTVSYNRKVFVGGQILFGQIGFRRPHHFRAQKAVSFRANRFPEAASFSGAQGRVISGKSVFGGRIISGTQGRIISGKSVFGGRIISATLYIGPGPGGGPRPLWKKLVWDPSQYIRRKVDSLH